MLPWTVHIMILLSQVHQKSCASQLNPIKTQLEHPPLLGTGGGRFAHNNWTAGGAGDTLVNAGTLWSVLILNTQF